MPKVRSQIGVKDKIMLLKCLETAIVNFISFHRKIKRDKKVPHLQDLGYHAHGQEGQKGQMSVFPVITQTASA